MSEYSDNTLNGNIDDTSQPDGIRGYRAKYQYDLVGNRLGRQVNVVNNTHSPYAQEILSTRYTDTLGNPYYDDGDRLRKEQDLSSAIFTALGGEANRVYAYADGKGGFGYTLADRTGRIGQFGAFWRGLPSVWDRGLLIFFAVLIPLMVFGPMLTQQWRRIRGAVIDGPRPTLSLYHRCLCVLFAYIFLIGPDTFVQLASAEVNYSTLSTQAWGQNDQTIEYGYDDNGAQIRKTTKVTSTQQTVEELRYDYTLRGQLQRVVDTNKTWDTLTDDKTVADYRYNPSGIRVGKTDYVNGVATTQTRYLIDPFNPTGYAQVLEEWTGGTTPAVTYTIGDDIISQSIGGTVSHFVYDGHGSTRQLIRPNKSVIDNYSYDGYGVMLGDATTPNPAQTAATKYLYAGEQYDKTLSHYYLRARYYNPNNGRFNQTDPFAGNPSDPQSLHKYLYANCNPINNIDPSGEFSMVGLSISMTVGAIIGAALGATYAHYTQRNILKYMLIGAGLGAAAGALGYLLWSGLAALKSSSLQRFFWDPRTFKTISSQYWQQFGPAAGRSLHHWLIPQRWTWIPQGIRNAGFNLLELPKLLPGRLGLNQWLGFVVRWGGSRMVVGMLIENGIRILIPITAVASYHAGKWLGNELTSQNIPLQNGGSATPLELTPQEEEIMQNDAGASLWEESENVDILQ